MNPRASAFVDYVRTAINALGQLKANGAIPDEDHQDALVQVVELAVAQLPEPETIRETARTTAQRSE